MSEEDPMERFLRTFWPYQFCRFIVLNLRIFAAAKGWGRGHSR